MLEAKLLLLEGGQGELEVPRAPVLRGGAQLVGPVVHDAVLLSHVFQLVPSLLQLQQGYFDLAVCDRYVHLSRSTINLASCQPGNKCTKTPTSRSRPVKSLVSTK